MKWHSIKCAFLAAVSLLITTTSVNAWQQQSCDWGCQSQQCAPCCPCGCLCLQGDLLYWKARGSNIVYLADFEDKAFSTSDQEEVFDVFRLVTKRKSLNYDRDVGFRVGARYDFACNCYNAAFLWTHLKTEASGKKSPFKDKLDFISPFKSFYDVDAHYNLDLNYWDLELGRCFCVSRCVNARLFLGIRGAHIDQKYKSFSIYQVADSRTMIRQLSGLVFSDRELTIREKHKFNGAGPRIGVDFDADLYCDISLYGQAAVSGLVGYSKHEVDDCFTDAFMDFATERSVNRQVAGVFVVQDIDERNQKVQSNRAMTDFAIGLRWNPSCLFCCQNLVLRFGWEHHALFGQKYAHFGKDKLPATDKTFIITEFVPSRVFGECNSTLAVHGFVFSGTLCF